MSSVAYVDYVHVQNIDTLLRSNLAAKAMLRDRVYLQFENFPLTCLCRSSILVNCPICLLLAGFVYGYSLFLKIVLNFFPLSHL